MAQLRRVMLLLTAFASATAALPAQGQLPADSAAFVMRIGRDTVKVERVVLREGRLRSESVSRGVGIEYQRLDATLNPDGSVVRAELRRQPWPVDASTAPNDRGLVYVQGDSTIIELGLPPTTRRIAYPGRGHLFNLGDIPISVWWFVSLAAHAPRVVGDSLALRHMAGTIGVRRLLVRRTAPDRVTAQSSVMGKLRIRVDSLGRMQALDGIGSSLNFLGERVDWVDLDSVARSFDGMDRTAGAIGELSPRDSVLATVGGATLKIDYARPSKRGRVIFGGIVPWNRVWRTGANFATHFSTDRALAFGDTVVPAGRYTLFTLPTEAGWTLIVSGQTGQWGTEYDARYDVARIPMRTRTRVTPVERFTIILEPRGSSGDLRLAWDTVEASVGFEVR